MVYVQDIVMQIRATLPEAQVSIEDLTGTRDHFRVTVVAPDFEGKEMIDRHRMVYQILHKSMEAQGGGIHALSLSTYTPQQWSNNGNL